MRRLLKAPVTMHGGTCLWYLESSSSFSALNSRCYYPLEVFARDGERGRAERGETKGRYEEGGGQKKKGCLYTKSEPEKKLDTRVVSYKLKLGMGIPYERPEPKT